MTVDLPSNNIQIGTGEAVYVLGESGWLEINYIDNPANPSVMYAQRVADSNGNMPLDTGFALLEDGVSLPIVTYRVRSQVIPVAGNANLTALLQAGQLQTEVDYQKN
jgi:hypothetical protein